MTDNYIPKQVNLISFAKAGKTLEGKIPIGNTMPRLAAVIIEGSEDIDASSYRLDFSCDEVSQYIIDGMVKASVKVVCQRCMEPMTLDMSSSFKVMVVAAGTDMDQLPEDCEPLILEGETVSPAELLEDELILCVPYAPMHEDACSEYLRNNAEQETGAQQKENPFSVLKDL